jgi:hypothetical protein
MSVIAEPISPELVLVSPPEVASVARAQLRETSADSSHVPRAELAAVYLFCLLFTLGPVLFLMALAG